MVEAGGETSAQPKESQAVRLNPNRFGRKRGLLSRYPSGLPQAISAISQKAHGFVERVLPDSFDKKTLNKAISIETNFALGHLPQGVETRKTTVPDRRKKEEKREKPIQPVERGYVFRFERAEITRVLKVFKSLPERRALLQQIERAKRRQEDPESHIKALREFDARFRSGVTELERNLDILNRQFYDNEQRVTVTDSEGRVHEVSVITLDLHPPKDGEKDTRVPIVRIPSFLSNAHNDAALSRTLALGHKVVIPTFSENPMSIAPKGWLETLTSDGTFRPTAEIMEKVIQALGIEEFDLYGTSRGAAVALQMAIDLSSVIKYSKLKIRKLIAIEPTGIIPKKIPKQLFDFGVVEGIRSTVNAENRIKSVISQPFPTVSEPVSPIKLAPSLSRQQFTLEDLVGIGDVDEFQIWLGGKSAITGRKTLDAVLKARELRIASRPNEPALKVVVVDEVGHDFPFVYAEGVVDHSIGEDAPKEGVTYLNSKELDNSAVRNLIRRAA